MTVMMVRILRRCWHGAVIAFALVGFGVAVITTTPLASWYALRLAGPWADPRGDVLIVPAGDAWDAEAMGQDTHLRAVYAARAYREGFRRVVVSGAGAADQMRAFLLYMGVPAQAVQVENRAASTRENALYTAALLAGESGRKVLLTSDYHMFRARRAFRKAGLDVEPRPIPDALKRATNPILRWQVFLGEASEQVKIGYYFLRGWV